MFEDIHFCEILYQYYALFLLCANYELKLFYK